MTRKRKDSSKDKCAHCGKEIVYRAGYDRWYHIHNILSFCDGGTEFEAKPVGRKRKRNELRAKD